MVCDPALRQPLLSRSSFWRPKEEKATAYFLGQLIKTLGIKPGDVYPSSFLSKKGFGTRLNGDRGLQRRVAQIINQYQFELENQTVIQVQRYYPAVASLQEAKLSLEEIADKPNGDSLVIVDAMIVGRTVAPLERQSMFETHTRYQGNCIRTIEYMLADSPGYLLTLKDPVIGLMVDRQSVSHCTEAFNAILAAGWYPYTRVAGLYATVPGGHSFVNVIAILVRSYPSLEEILVPMGELPECCLPGMLEQLLTRLDQEIKTLQEEKSKATNIGDGTSAATSIPKVYEKDAEFLYPGYLFKLFCELNKVSWQELQAQERRLLYILKAYMQRLLELGKYLKDLGRESLIIDLMTNIERLLPGP
jgi:hypothetical protein